MMSLFALVHASYSVSADTSLPSASSSSWPTFEGCPSKCLLHTHTLVFITCGGFKLTWIHFLETCVTPTWFSINVTSFLIEIYSHPCLQKEEHPYTQDAVVLMINIISTDVQNKQWALRPGVLSVTIAWWDVSHTWVSSLSANMRFKPSQKTVHLSSLWNLSAFCSDTFCHSDRKDGYECVQHWFTGRYYNNDRNGPTGHLLMTFTTSWPFQQYLKLPLETHTWNIKN